MCRKPVAWIRKASGWTSFEDDAVTWAEVMVVLIKNFMANRDGIARI